MGPRPDLEQGGDLWDQPHLHIPHPFHLDLLGGREGRGPAPDPAPFPGCLNALLRSLDDPVPLKMGNQSEKVRHQPIGRGVCSQGPELGTFGFDQVKYPLRPVRRFRP